MLQIRNFWVGIDIENISRFKKFTNDRNNSFLHNIFTEDELDFCFSKKVVANHLAVRYAGKEASIKALCGIGLENIDYKDIEILSNINRVPIVRINNLNSNKIQARVSLSHCKDKALAFAVVMEFEVNGKN